MLMFLLLLLFAGDWTISIKYDDRHIQGSPFNVRVYDASQVKVFGLQAGSVAKDFSFSGKLELFHDDQNLEIPALIADSVNLEIYHGKLQSFQLTPDPLNLFDGVMPAQINAPSIEFFV